MTRWLTQLRLRFRSLFLGGRVEQELDEELQYHLERQIEEGVAAGLAPEEARYAALRDMGAIAQSKEECRDMRRVNVIENLMQDVRYALRILRKNPGFTAVAVMTMALGIGVNTALFSVIYAVLLRPLPYPEAERIVHAFENRKAIPRGPVSPLNFFDWRERNRVFSEIAAFRIQDARLGGGNETELIRSVQGSAGLFAVLGVNAALGRLYSVEEDRPGTDHVVVLGNAFWKSRFGGDAAVTGKTILLNGRSTTVIGVLPPGIEVAPFEADLWVPLRLGSEPVRMKRTEAYLSTVARLRVGVSLARARADIESIAQQLEREYPASNSGARVELLPFDEHLVGGVRRPLLVLGAAVGFVLLIAATNVANLILARNAARHGEFVMRSALGAGRTRLIQQVLIESATLGLLGGTCGVLLAHWGAGSIVALMPKTIPRSGEIAVDGAVLAFSVALSVLIGIAVGLLPALRASRCDLNEALKQRARGSTSGPAARNASALLIVGEVALTAVLLAGAGLLIRTMWELLRISPGFDPSGALVMQVRVPGSDWSRFAGQYERLLAEVQSLPGVEAAGATNHLPLSGEWSMTRFTVEGRPLPNPSQVPNVNYRVVTRGYFSAMRIRLIEGRDFDARDYAKAPSVILVNETMAHMYWVGESPVGRRLRRGGVDSKRQWDTIVGVVSDVRHFGLHAAPRAEVYIPHPQFPWPEMYVVVRTTGEPLAMAPAIGRTIRNAVAGALVPSVRPMESYVTLSVASQRFNMWLLAAFAGLALFLSSVGLYGVISYAVAQRTQEMGIRLALGATPGSVTALVVNDGLRLGLAGMAVGVCGALVLTRLLASMLYGVSAYDPMTFACAGGLLLLVLFIAAWLPARRAARVDPVVALRYE